MQTPYYSNIKNNIGSTIFNLNTICVALEQIEDGNFSKPNTLTLSWESKDPKNDAKKARRNAINLFLIASVDAIEDYITNVTSHEFLISAKGVESIKNADGLQSKIELLFNEKKSNANILPYWISCIKLLVVWRNILVHKSKASLSLKAIDIKNLECNYKRIYKSHSHTNILRTLRRYNNKEYPTLKDFSTLFTIMLKSFSTFDAIISEDISKEAIKELIIFKLGTDAINSEFTNKILNIDALKKFAKNKSIKYEDNISLKEIQKKILIYLGNKKFNTLVASETTSLRKVKNYCHTHSIPYKENLLNSIIKKYL